MQNIQNQSKELCFRQNFYLKPILCLQLTKRYHAFLTPDIDFWKCLFPTIALKWYVKFETFIMQHHQLKKSKFSHLEAHDDDLDEKDEVNVYSTQLNSFNLADSEINIVSKFWKSNEKSFPNCFGSLFQSCTLLPVVATGKNQ